MNTVADPIFITTDAVGGVWSYSVALAQGLAEAGLCSVLAVMGPRAQPAQRDAAAGIAGCRLLETGLPLDWTATSRGELDTAVLALLEQARAAGCRAAHLHAPCLASRPWPMATVAVAHSCMATWWDAVRGGARPPDIAWHHAATAEGLALADAVIAPSGAFAAALARVYGPERPATVVHNGLNQPPLHRSQRRRAVLAAGRLWDPGKNVAVLDAAAALLAVPVLAAGPIRAPDGSGQEFAHLRGIGNLPPAVLHRLMAETAMFAAPSLYEPFGLAVLEAAQQAAPLILSDIPTFRELWSGAATFVPANDPVAWANAIASLADDDDRLAALGSAALQRSRRYTLDATVSATLEVHRGVGQRALRAA